MSDLATLRKTFVEQRREIRKRQEQFDAAVVAARLAAMQMYTDQGKEKFSIPEMDAWVWEATYVHRQAVSSATLSWEETGLAIDLLCDERNQRVIDELEKLAARAAQGRAE